MWDNSGTNFDRNIAVIIGINQHQNGIAKLKTAKPDAETRADLLRDEYQYQVELIIDFQTIERSPPHRVVIINLCIQLRLQASVDCFPKSRKFQ